MEGMLSIFQSKQIQPVTAKIFKVSIGYNFEKVDPPSIASDTTLIQVKHLVARALNYSNDIHYQNLIFCNTFMERKTAVQQFVGSFLCKGVFHSLGHDVGTKRTSAHGHFACCDDGGNVMTWTNDSHHVVICSMSTKSILEALFLAETVRRIILKGLADIFVLGDPSYHCMTARIGFEKVNKFLLKKAIAGTRTTVDFKITGSPGQVDISSSSLDGATLIQSMFYVDQAILKLSTLPNDN